MINTDMTHEEFMKQWEQIPKWELSPNREKHEKEDLVRRILKFNNNIFKEELFWFGRLGELDYLDTVFILRDYKYTPNEFLWRRTNLEKVRQYKNNQKASVSREDVALLYFFKQLSVL